MKLLEIVDEIQAHPHYEYIEVYFDWWRNFFSRKKTGLIVSGAYSGKRECKSLIEGLNQLGAESWKIVDNNHVHHHYDEDRLYFNSDNYKYILERKITPLFNQTILDFHSETSNNLYKSLIINRTREEEALEEYEHDTMFKEEFYLSVKAYCCLKIADLASTEGLHNLGCSSKVRMMKIANMEQDVADEIIQWIEKNFEIEIEEGQEEEEGE